MDGTGGKAVPDGWAAELVHLLRRLRMTSGLDPATGRPVSLRRIASRSGYSLSHVHEVMHGKVRPSPDAVTAIATALNATHDERRQAAFCAEQLQQAPGGRRGGTPALDRLTMPIPRGLPHDVRDFVGREAELAQLNRYTRDAQTPGAVLISAIDGVAGVGKTALAVRFAHQIAGRFPDGQLHVNLRGFDPKLSPLDPTVVLDQFLRSLGIDPAQIPSDVDERAHLYLSVIANRRVLLLLDNAATAEQVRPLLPATNRCLAIVTSRNRLSGLVARDGARRLSVDVLTTTEAVELLSATAGEDRIRAERDAAVEVALLAGRLPLALRIVAERLSGRPHLSMRDLKQELDDERGRLAVLTADDDEHMTVQSVFSWSYRQLPSPVARAFRLLGLHAGTEFSLAAGAALIAAPVTDTSALLHRLVAASLLEEVGRRRYRFHDLLRVYAVECANADEATDERDEAVERSLTWYLRNADAAARVILPRAWHIDHGMPTDAGPTAVFTSVDEALRWCETERTNLTAATDQAVSSTVPAVAWLLPLALFVYYMFRRRWADWLATHRTALTTARALGDRYAEGCVLVRLSTIHQDLREFDEALSCCRTSLLIFGELGDTLGEAWAVTCLSAIHLARRDLHEALTLSIRGIELARELDEPVCESLGLTWLSLTYQRLGRYEEAIEPSRQALAICARDEFRYGQAWILNNLGTIHRRLGRYDDAIDLCHQSLHVQRENGDRKGEASVLHSLGKTFLLLGETAEARAAWGQALEIFDSIGDPKAAIIRAELDEEAQHRNDS